MIESERGRKSARACVHARNGDRFGRELKPVKSAGHLGRRLRQVKNGAAHSGETSGRDRDSADAKNTAAPRDTKRAADKINSANVSAAAEMRGGKVIPQSAAGPAFERKAATEKDESSVAESDLDRDPSGVVQIARNRKARSAVPASFVAEIAGKADRQGHEPRGRVKVRVVGFAEATAEEAGHRGRAASDHRKANVASSPAGQIADAGATPMGRKSQAGRVTRGTLAEKTDRAEGSVREQVRLSTSGLAAQLSFVIQQPVPPEPR